MSCPGIEELERFIAGGLDDPSRGQIDRHVRDCGRCPDMIAELKVGLMLAGRVAARPEAGSTGAAWLQSASGRGSSSASAATESCAADTSSGNTTSRELRRHGPGVVDVPSRLGQFEVGRELGRGGLGVVCLARDTILQRDVAIKFCMTLHANRADRDHQVFLRGAQVACRIRHPGLNSVLAADVHADVPYLVLEYVPGPTLAALVAATGSFPPGLALATVREVGEAVHELHRNDVIHRDIKPPNILVDPEGRLQLTDFGVTDTRSTAMMKYIVGTPAFMAPEVLAGESSARSDIFALGVTLYFLLTGKLPNVASSISAVPEAESPLNPELRRVGVPDAVCDLVFRATHPNPNFRLKSAVRLVEAINDLGTLVATPFTASAERARLVARMSAQASAAPPVVVEPARDGSGLRGLESRIRTRRDTRVQTQERSAPPANDASCGAAPRELPCVKCAYNVLWLDRGGHCPECGTSLVLSDEPNRLLFADRRWLERVCSGLKWTSRSIIAAFVVLVYLFLTLPSLASRIDQTWVPVLLVGYFVVAPALVSAGFLIGTQCFLSKEPGSRVAESGASPRRVAKISAFALVSVFAILMVGNLVGAFRLNENPVLFGAVLTGTAAMTIGSALFYLGGLALRAAPARGSGHPRVVATLLLFLTALVIVGVGSRWLHSFLLPVTLCLLGLAGLSCSQFYYRLLRRVIQQNTRWIGAGSV